ncbi:hypothetical protein [Colwellia sp. 75C3]|uniref:hypothetical protein n=1 Tax=Colwellia sp. 75C3 TaxID=888425 RepID=UPI0012FF2CD3|nr:hypothetical protein [Colwellia sp. 75C3]
MKLKKKYPKMTPEKTSKMVKGVTDIMKAHGTKTDFHAMQSILFPLMAVKKELDLRQEHKKSVRQSLEVSEIIDEINTHKRALYRIEGKICFKVEKNEAGFEGFVDIEELITDINIDVINLI